MPQASAGYVPQIKYMFKTHDTVKLFENPPILNQWYTVLTASDVRLIECLARQTNTETNVKTIQIRWTVDGVTYMNDTGHDNNTWYWWFRNYELSTGGTQGLYMNKSENQGYLNNALMCQDILIEARITTALGTSQTLEVRVLYETLEAT